MLKLGNVVISKEELLTEKGKEVKENKLLNIYNSLEELKNKNLPTLVIGWNYVKKNIEGVSILNKKIEDNLYWTFSSTEKIQDFNENIDEFIDKLGNDIVRGVKFILIDPIVDNLKTIDDLISIVPPEVYTYQNEDMIYCYSQKNDTIYGLDINILEFLEFEISDIINSLKNKSISYFVEDYKENRGIFFYKKFLNIKNITKFVPYLQYKETKN